MLTDLYTDDDTRAEFLEGARLLRLKEAFPQQLLVADILNAGKEANALLLPRRATKTTSVQAVILGRCSLREDYVAAMTVTTTGSKARSMFRKDVIAPLERVYPDPQTRPFKTLKGNGSERIEWPNGSVYTAETPIADSFRGGAYDIVLVDESGEADVAQGDDLKAGILATFDTREGQVVYAGTPADYREGNLLWDGLHDERASRIGYFIDDDTDEQLLASWETVEPLVLATHPGVACGLTPLHKLEDRYKTLGPERFAREYLGVFGQVGNTKTLIRADKFISAGTDAPLPAPPAKFGLAFAVHAELPKTSVVAAWRDDEGKAHGLVLETFNSYTPVAEYLNGLWKKYRMPIAFDPHFAYAKTIAENLERAKPRPKLIPATSATLKTAAALLVRNIHEDNAVHYKQDVIVEGAAVAVKRQIGVGGFAFGRVLAEDDITALEAWSLALKAYDDQFEGKGNVAGIMFAA